METCPENTDKKQDSRFRSGESGNPSGRPKGSLNKTTLMMRSLLEEEAEAITRKVIELAKEGDQAAIKMVIERLLPPRKDAPLNVTLPSISKTEDVLAAIAVVHSELSAGAITPLEAEALCSLIEHSRKAIETHQLAEKLKTLETIINLRK